MKTLLLMHGFIAILILLYMLINSFYIRKQLGKLEYRVFTRLQNVGMTIFLLMLVLRVGANIYGLNAYVRTEDTIYLILSIREIAPIAINLLIIYFIYKNGEIREKGVYAGFSILKWQHIKYFVIQTEEIIEVTTNKKSVFSKKYKKVKWEVDSKVKLKKLKDLLIKYIKENEDTVI